MYEYLRADDGLIARAGGAAGARAALLVPMLQPAGPQVLRRRVRLGSRLRLRARHCIRSKARARCASRDVRDGRREVELENNCRTIIVNT